VLPIRPFCCQKPKSSAASVEPIESQTLLTIQQDVLIYCKAIESDSDKENQKLQARLNEVELDLKAATKTRRDLQKSLEEAELQVKWVMRQNDEIKVY
jgi:septal ring factor EnvC (AmiA/AmiB activator)